MLEGFSVNSDGEGEYWSEKQQVRYTIRPIIKKSEFKTALETEDLHVVYDGHSRYGRGTCFSHQDDAATGDQWGFGTDNDDGLFHLGYPYVAVELHDISTHQYQFAPIAVTEDIPPVEERHPEARGRPDKILLPEELRPLVRFTYESDTNQYWGFAGAQPELLVVAGWRNTITSPFDLGAVDIKCRCFCHFGCSSRVHFWRIVRKDEYKAWQRDTPPTTNFAYFSTETTYPYITLYWLYYLLKYDQPNAHQSWWNSLEGAKRGANARLQRERRGYLVY